MNDSLETTTPASRAQTRRLYVVLLLLTAVLFVVAPPPCGGFCALIVVSTLYYSIFAWLLNLVIALALPWIPAHRYGLRLLSTFATLALLLLLPTYVLAVTSSSTLRVWLYVFGICAPAFCFPLTLAIWAGRRRRSQ